MILFPYYALAQALVMPPIGAFQYLRVARRSRQLGRYRMGLRRGRWTPPPRARRRRRSLRPCRWNLDSLEQFVRTLSPSSERLHELQLTLVHLRAYADLEGWLPTSFHELVLEVFPEAAERRSRRGDPSQLAAA